MNERLLAFTPEADQAVAAAAHTIGPHFAPKAKQVIYLFMAGAPSQVDLFDNKPLLRQYDGQEIPKGFIPEGERFAFVKGTPRLLGSPFDFKLYGQSGAEISELLPNLQKHADEIAIIRSMKTTQFNHAPAQIFMNTGHQIIGRPSVGSWLSYGLGSDNKDLPAFVVLDLGAEQPGRRQELLGQRLSAHRPSGRRVPIEGRAGALLAQPGRRGSEGAARIAGPRARSRSRSSTRARAIPRRRRASRRTSWRTGCRRASPS